MRHIALTVSYDGTHWCGSQRQNNGATIQGELERALEKSLQVPTPVTLAGRTDAGNCGIATLLGLRVQLEGRHDIISAMLTTYEAVLHGNLIEWHKDRPQQVSSGQTVNVHVTVLEEVPVGEKQGELMAGALSKLAQSHALADVDGQQWERETRTDKPLIGRSE